VCPSISIPHSSSLTPYQFYISLPLPPLPALDLPCNPAQNINVSFPSTGKLNSLLSDTSPFTLLTPSFPSTLSIHGSADTLIPLSDSLALKSALEKLGIVNKLLVVEGGEHGLELAEARGEEWGRVVGWLERWV
jgi:dipeptidyl aminopeptidase/acylaminoacyl peptidase